MYKWIWLALLLVLAQVSAFCQTSPLPADIVSQPGQLIASSAKSPAGVYRITYRLRIDALDNAVTPLATLAAHVPGYYSLISKQITAINFTAANTPTDFTFLLDNFAAQSISANVTVTPNVTPKLTVDRITIAPVRELCVGSVWPGKICYRTNEAAQGMVSVFNGTDAPQKAILLSELASDLNTHRALKDIQVSLAPGERKDIPVTWNTGKEEYGFALVAKLVDVGGDYVSEAREYFSVADNLWKVGLTLIGRGCSPPFGPGPNQSIPVAEIKKYENLLAQELAKPFAPVYWNYTNYREFYAWSPDDFFNMAPEADYWYSGTGNYTMGKRHLQLAIEWLHKRGMRATAYLNPFSIGYGGEEAYRRHPEWFVYDKNGQLALFSYYQKKLESGYKLSQEGPWKLHLAPYASSLNVNITTLDPVNAQVEQIVKAQKMFGWDGIRYDNFTYTADGYDFWGKKIDGNDPNRKDALEVRAWIHMRESVWKQLGPNFVVGGNGDHQFRDRFPAVWDESCRKGQLRMEEVPRSSYSADSQTNRWHDYMVYYHNSGEVIRGLGGHHLTIGFDRQHPVDHLYLSIFTYAGRTHPYGNMSADTLPLGNYAAFVTRYSALLWDIDRVKALPNPEKKIAIQSARPVWWQEYATVRATPDGKRQYILHLVNPPVQERIYTDPTNKVPAPQKDITVTLKLDGGEKITRATLLSPDLDIRQVPLRVTTKDGQVSVTVPELYFWDMLVLE
ncbi:MAG: glycoside hydrolase family 66 protein [Armatimonadota bacterium]